MNLGGLHGNGMPKMQAILPERRSAAGGRHAAARAGNRGFRGETAGQHHPDRCRSGSERPHLCQLLVRLRRCGGDAWRRWLPRLRPHFHRSRLSRAVPCPAGGGAGGIPRHAGRLWQFSARNWPRCCRRTRSGRAMSRRTTPPGAIASFLSTARKQNVFPVGAGIGQGLSLGIGAAAAANGRKTVVMTGDGGFFLNVGELWTAVQEKLDISIDGDERSRLRRDQAHPGRDPQGRRFYADLQGPDLGQLSAIAGIPFWKVEQRRSVRATVAKSIATQGTEPGGGRHDRGRRVPRLLSVQPARRLMAACRALGDGRAVRPRLAVE